MALRANEELEQPAERLCCTAVQSHFLSSSRLMLLWCCKHLCALVGIRMGKRLIGLSFVADCVITKKYILAYSTEYKVFFSMPNELTFSVFCCVFFIKKCAYTKNGTLTRMYQAGGNYTRGTQQNSSVLCTLKACFLPRICVICCSFYCFNVAGCLDSTSDALYEPNRSSV